jgi:hypothetical protein
MKRVMLIIGLLFVIACAPSEKQCSVDTDCVQASCCHASDAVNKEFSPDCRTTLCSLECKPGTLDCGQGQVKCVNNECKAVIEG